MKNKDIKLLQTLSNAIAELDRLRNQAVYQQEYIKLILTKIDNRGMQVIKDDKGFLSIVEKDKTV